MTQHSSTLLLFGATGDLSKRMLLPSLYLHFYCNNCPTKFSVPVNLLIRTGIMLGGGVLLMIFYYNISHLALGTQKGISQPEQFPMIPTISPASKRRLTLSRAKSDPFAVLKVLLSPLISIIVSSYISKYIKAPIRRTRAYPCYHLGLFINHFINLIKYASDWFIL